MRGTEERPALGPARLLWLDESDPARVNDLTHDQRGAARLRSDSHGSIYVGHGDHYHHADAHV